MDQIDAWIEQGVLNGPELNAADFQIAANLAAMLISEDGAPFARGRPAEALARRVAPDYTGSVGKHWSQEPYPGATARVAGSAGGWRVDFAEWSPAAALVWRGWFTIEANGVLLPVTRVRQPARGGDGPADRSPRSSHQLATHSSLR